MNNQIVWFRQIVDRFECEVRHVLDAIVVQSHKAAGQDFSTEICSAPGNNFGASLVNNAWLRVPETIIFMDYVHWLFDSIKLTQRETIRCGLCNHNVAINGCIVFVQSTAAITENQPSIGMREQSRINLKKFSFRKLKFSRLFRSLHDENFFYLLDAFWWFTKIRNEKQMLRIFLKIFFVQLLFRQENWSRKTISQHLNFLRIFKAVSPNNKICRFILKFHEYFCELNFLTCRHKKFGKRKENKNFKHFEVARGTEFCRKLL